jgi:ribosomal protein L11 methyltransferase
MTHTPGPVWQVSILGDFETLKVWANAQDGQDESPWLALSVFESTLPEGRLQLLFSEEVAAKTFADQPALAAMGSLDCLPLQDENWIAKSLAGLPVVRAGRFFVHGAHHEMPKDAALVSILIEAGEAFGTGHHGTTKGCLLAFEDSLAHKPPRTVLDMGTGAGTLAIAAAKVLPKADILATDIDPIAIDVARQNAAINAVAERLKLIVADGFAHDGLKGRRFDLVFANILANPLIAMAPDICAALAPGARLILSGILDHQAARVRCAYEVQGLEFIRDYALEEWRVLVLQNPA